jgi:hypothetical protein
VTGMTADEVKQLMKDAVKAIEEANVPDDLRVTAFEKSFDALLGATEAKGVPAELEEPAPPARRTAPTAGPSLASIASRLGVDGELVDEIFYEDGDFLALALAPSRFDPRKAAATQQIALLLAAGRQAGGWEEWTAVGVIREVCRDYGRFDVANFATTIKRMGDVFNFRGRARQLEVRVTRPGYEQAADLVRALGGA